MHIETRQLLQADFEKYMTAFYAMHRKFSLEDFGAFATTVINNYINNNVILLEDKSEAAYFLTTLYNKGIGNRIIEDHLLMISQTITNDTTVDFEVIKMLFA